MTDWIQPQTQLSRRSLTVLIGMLLVLVLAGIFGPLLVAYPQGFGPDVLQAPSWQHPFGTDSLGRDILAQTIWGTRTSLMIALGVGVIVIAVGGVVGLLSAYSKWADRLLGTVVDVMLSVPVLPLMIVIAAFAGSSLLNVILVLGFVSWPPLARIIRAQALTVMREPYVDASRALGAGLWRILGRAVLPATLPLIALHGGLAASRAVLGEASLSFLGLSDPTTWSWGRILHNAQRDGVLVSAWWQVLFPALLILLFISLIVLLGIRLTDRAETLRTKLPAR